MRNDAGKLSDCGERFRLNQLRLLGAHRAIGALDDADQHDIQEDPATDGR